MILAGKGPLEKKYRRLAEKLPNPIVMEFYEPERLREILHMADLYVHTSDAEIEAMSCMEAFACGLVPVIADSPRSATPQFALDGRSLFPAGDTAALAERIDWWMEHPEERAGDGAPLRRAHRELLARLIQCEAGGEGENGMKAVAGVVMNRVHARGGEYARVGQGSIRNIIFQPYQFVCASETEGGVYNPQNIYNMRPEQIHYDIADWAIAGNRLPDVAESLWFYNPFGPTCRSFFPSDVGYWQTRIGDHCFYNPTNAYYQT